jgi:type I restriction enzyme S subunit
MELTKTNDVLSEQTEVGLFPDDWKLTSLDSITVSISSGKSSTISIISGEIPIYGSTGIIGCSSISDYSGKRILIARVGANAGAVYWVDGQYNVSDNTLMIKLKEEVDFSFIRLYLKKINLNKMVFGSGQPLITGGQLKSIQIPLPPTLNEQKAIATALSDVDALISSLDKLITKKKAIKQGAMQELLTPPHKGGRRLPGYSGEWEEKNIGKIGTTYGGLTNKTASDFENGEFPYITFLNVMNNSEIDCQNFAFVRIKPGENQNKAQKGDLFFNTSSETPEEVGMCAVLNEEIPNLYLNSFCFGFRFKDTLEMDGLFFSYLVNSEIGRDLFKSLAQGVTRYNLSKTNFNKLTIIVPALVEQKEIARILRDMELEIKALKLKQDKLIEVKQGMMQELLTGKTRLV